MNKVVRRYFTVKEVVGFTAISLAFSVLSACGSWFGRGKLQSNPTVEAKSIVTNAASSSDVKSGPSDTSTEEAQAKPQEQNLIVTPEVKPELRLLQLSVLSEADRLATRLVARNDSHAYLIQENGKTLKIELSSGLISEVLSPSIPALSTNPPKRRYLVSESVAWDVSDTGVEQFFWNSEERTLNRRSADFDSLGLSNAWKLVQANTTSIIFSSGGKAVVITANSTGLSALSFATPVQADSAVEISNAGLRNDGLPWVLSGRNIVYSENEASGRVWKKLDFRPQGDGALQSVIQSTEISIQKDESGQISLSSLLLGERGIGWTESAASPVEVPDLITGGGGENGGVEDKLWNLTIQPIVAAKCANCHTASPPYAHSFAPGGKSDRDIFIIKKSDIISRIGRDPSAAGAMPRYGSAPLTDLEKQSIIDWLNKK